MVLMEASARVMWLVRRVRRGSGSRLEAVVQRVRKSERRRAWRGRREKGVRRAVMSREVMAVVARSVQSWETSR